MANPYTSGAAPAGNSPMDFIAPDIASGTRSLARRQQIADLLRMQALQTGGNETQMAGGWAIPNSPTKPFEKLARALVARSTQGQIDEEQSALSKDYSARLAAALNGKTGPEAAMAASALGFPPEAVMTMGWGGKNTVHTLTQGDRTGLYSAPERGAGAVTPLFESQIGRSPDAVLSAETSTNNSIRAAGQSDINSQRSANTSRYSTDVGAASTRRGQDISQETALTLADPTLKGAQAAAKARATGAVEAQLSLPAVLQRGEDAIAALDALVGTAPVPGGKKGTGMHKGAAGILGRWMPETRAKVFGAGGPEADFVSRFEAVKSQAFLQGFDQLKGAGAITEIEGAKGQSAINRMTLAQKPEDFLAAAREAQAIYRKGMETARQLAQEPAPGFGTGTAGGSLGTYVPGRGLVPGGN